VDREPAGAASRLQPPVPSFLMPGGDCSQHPSVPGTAGPALTWGLCPPSFAGVTLPMTCTFSRLTGRGPRQVCRVPGLVRRPPLTVEDAPVAGLCRLARSNPACVCRGDQLVTRLSTARTGANWRRLDSDVMARAMLPGVPIACRSYHDARGVDRTHRWEPAAAPDHSERSHTEKSRRHTGLLGPQWSPNGSRAAGHRLVLRGWHLGRA